MLTKDQIIDVLFEETNESVDDGDPLFEGVLFLTLTGNRKKQVELDWIRFEHYDHFTNDSKRVRIKAVVDYQETYDKDFTKMWSDWTPSKKKKRPSKIEVMYIEGNVAEEIELDGEFNAETCLEFLVNDTAQDDWNLQTDQVFAGMHFIQYIDPTDGESRQFIYKGE